MGEILSISQDEMKVRINKEKVPRDQHKRTKVSHLEAGYDSDMNGGPVHINNIKGSPKEELTIIVNTTRSVP